MVQIKYLIGSKLTYRSGWIRCYLYYNNIVVESTFNSFTIKSGKQKESRLFLKLETEITFALILQQNYLIVAVVAFVVSLSREYDLEET